MIPNKNHQNIHMLGYKAYDYNEMFLLQSHNSIRPTTAAYVEYQNVTLKPQLVFRVEVEESTNEINHVRPLFRKI